MKSLLVLVSAAFGTIATCAAATYTAADAFKIGAFIEGNGTFNNSESEGTVVVGGNFTTGQNKWQVSLRPGAQTLSGGVALAVGGNVTIGSGNAPGLVVTGAATYGGTVNKTVDQNNAAYFQANSVTKTPTDVTQAFKDLRLMSTRIAALTATPITFNDANLQNASNFYLNSTNATSAPLVMKETFLLYSIKASEMNAMNNPLNMNYFKSASSSDLIVINIIDDLGGTAGSPKTVTLGRTPLSAELADNVLWNISSAALSVTNTSREFQGSLLAPNSLFTQGDQTFNGSLIVKSFESGQNGAELHPVLFTGTPATQVLTSVVPEPTSAAVGVLLAFGLLRRQRR